MDGTTTPKLVSMALASTGIEPRVALRSLRLWSELLTELSAVVRPYNSAIRAELLLCKSLIEVLTSMVDNGTSPAELVSHSTTVSPDPSTGGSLLTYLSLRLGRPHSRPWLLADRVPPYHPLTLEDLMKARGAGRLTIKVPESGSGFTFSDALFWLASVVEVSVIALLGLHHSA